MLAVALSVPDFWLGVLVGSVGTITLLVAVAFAWDGRRERL